MQFLMERMTRQGLSAPAPATSSQVAGWAAGLQAQDLGASRLGTRARSSSVTEADVIDECDQRRGVVRTWLMRSTVHLVPAQDVRWMTALFGPMIERRFTNVRWRALGITAEVIDDAIPKVRAVLAGRELSRHEIRAELTERGVRLADDPQAATHLLLALSARGITCRGPDYGRETTFALVDDWVGTDASTMSVTNPTAELARRYFRAFGPATAADFTAWSGLASGAPIKSIRDELTEVEFDGRRGFSLGEVEAVPALRLLPMFDNYLIGYRNREAMLDPGLHAQVYVGGIIKASIVCDGRVIGIWRLERRGAATPTIRVTAFEALRRRHRLELERERADLERFFAAPIALSADG
jgi:hypothetical protein